jgi:dihydroflavonol-4-reductase
VKVLVTGATGFIGAHVARLASERGHEVRVAYRAEERLGRLEAVEVEPVKADVLDRAAMRRAARGCQMVFHTAGLVGSRPVERVFEVNALAPRVVVESAAQEGVARVVLTSSVGGIGPVRPGAVGDEQTIYESAGGMTYVDAKHEGEAQALAAAARTGVELVTVNPSYVLGVPLDPSEPGETSTRVVGSYLRGRLPAVVDADTDIVDVADVAEGHLLAAERGEPGERYVLGGHEISWPALVERVAELSGVHRPVVVLPRSLSALARAQETLRIPGFRLGEAIELMGTNWRYSSRKAERELGYRARPLDVTLADTIEWYLDLISEGAFQNSHRSAMGLAAGALRAADRLGAGAALQVVESWARRRMVVGR